MKITNTTITNPLTSEQETALNEIAEKCLYDMSDFTYTADCGIEVKFFAKSK